MGNDVTRAQALGDLIQVRRVVADVHHQRQVAVLFLHRFGAIQRGDAIFTDYAATHTCLQTDDKIRVAFHRLSHRISVNIGHVGQLVLGDKPNARDIQQRIHLGGSFPGQGVKIVDVIRPGTARIHHSSDASRNTDAIRLVVVNRGFRVAMNVGVNPACADVALAAQLNGFQRRAINVAQRRDLAVFERNITHRIVNEARTAQE